MEEDISECVYTWSTHNKILPLQVLACIEHVKLGISSVMKWDSLRSVKARVGSVTKESNLPGRFCQCPMYGATCGAVIVAEKDNHYLWTDMLSQ